MPCAANDREAAPARPARLRLVPLGRSELRIGPMGLGSNVFGWTVDEATAFSILDAFTQAGLNFIDTANVYSNWVPGNVGGESERMIGAWLRRNASMRPHVLLTTKVGSSGIPGQADLSRKTVLTEIDRSLRRLNTDHVDLYQAHFFDPQTPLEETLEAFAELIRQGKVRAIGASNHSATQLSAALAVSAATGLPRYECVQPAYSLYDRQSFDKVAQSLCRREQITVTSHSSLARGFLTGKYRTHADLSQSPRGAFLNLLPNTRDIFDARGQRILWALETVASSTGATPAQISLAWLLARGVTAPIVSATNLPQLHELMGAIDLSLSEECLQALDAASAPEQVASL